MKKILLVEDDEHLQILMKEELMEDGYEVMIASNGVEAMSMIRDAGNSDPDLVILDIHMPKMDGFETLGHILKSRLDAPIIIHTGYASYKVHPLAIAADAYIVKSHDFTTLKDTVTDLLARRNMTRRRLADPA